MPINKTAIITLLSSLCVVACSGPDDRRPPRPELTPERKAELHERFVDRWDFDGDGAVTCADVAFQRNQLFTLLDTNTDDMLTSGEYRYAKFEDKNFLFHLFTEVDTDGTGTISRSELNAVTHSQFVSLDKNGDCVVNEQEAEAAARERARENRSEQRGGKGGRGGPPRGGRPNGITEAPAS